MRKDRKLMYLAIIVIYGGEKYGHDFSRKRFKCGALFTWQDYCHGGSDWSRHTQGNKVADWLERRR